MSLRNSLYNLKSIGSATRRFFRVAGVYFVVVGMVSACAAFFSITDFFAIKASAQTKVDKPQIPPTPTPLPSPSAPVIFTASPMGSPEISDVMIQFDPTPTETLPPIPEPNELIVASLLAAGVLGAAAAARRRMSMKSAIEKTRNEVTRSAPPKYSEEVFCTVFTPYRVAQGDAFLVQAFAHFAQHAQVLREIAMRADLTAIERGSEKLGSIKLEQQLGFYLEIPGLEIDEPEQSLVWNGDITSLKFGVTVPGTFAPRSINCKLSVSQYNVPIGHIRFSLRISRQAEVGDNLLKVHQEFVKYRLAFISYASIDRSEVLKRVQMLDLVEVTYFQDLLSLEAGKRWEPLIYSYIDKCDVFYLFWSTAAKKSRWVKKEVKHALKRKGDKLDGPPEIMPIPIEGPPPVKPPRYLSAIHFDSRFLYFINPKDNNTSKLDSSIPKDIN